MFKKPNPTIVIALCTSAALIAFGFDQSHKASIAVSGTALFVAAAVVCLSPVFFALLRGKICDRPGSRPFSGAPGGN